jgi:cbb3-type cytochrome c oxidase subunit III|tara:strand:+ start:6994 stop:8910 length:1917 start_codon:yes stop_codon:yes gene_type:complete
MASKESGTRIQFVFAVVGLILALCGQAYAFTSPDVSDMPQTIQVDGKQVSLKDLNSPVTKSERASKEGAAIYIKNCVLCHGDLLDGRGLFGDSFFPRPANFLHSQSVLSKPQAYTYWRIMKGGPGLPEKYNPWDSAMPAWEGVLKEEDVWKVIQYIYSTAEERKQTKESPLSEPSADRGARVYADKCAVCHGDEGAGDGPGAKISSPFPRNFIKGHIKFRTTPFGKIPTDKDLFDIITQGMPGTTMPAWKHLPENDRHSLVLYLKTLSKKFAKFVKKGKTHKIVMIPDPPAFTLESLERGKELFTQNCSACHGVKGRGDGASTKKIVNIPTDSIWPRNLSKPWKFRRGDKRKEIFLTLRTGLSLSAMPRFSPRIFKDEQIWDLVHYVQTLAPSQKPKTPPILKVQKIDGALPTDPNDPLWKTMDSNFYPLGGQIIQSKKVLYPTVDNVVVKAMHNETEIAFHIHWDDPTVDPTLKKFSTVEESPAPPLPAHLRSDDDEEEPAEEPEAQQYADSIAIQFPISVNGGSGKPYFLNGDAEHPVNLWQWSSYPMKAVEVNATGIDTLKKQPEISQSLASKVIFKYGRYSLVIKRRLTTEDTQNDIQFRAGQTIPIAFNVWNGSAGETGSQKTISSWFSLVLE